MKIQNWKKTYNPGKWSGKAYNFFGDYLTEKYNCRVLKLPVNSGLSCPNRDGTLSRTGCIFCSEEGSASPASCNNMTIHEQMQNALTSFKRSSKNTRYIAYLQAFTNTYAPVHILKQIYDSAVSFPDITGLMIGTRPDCINSEILDLIKSYDKNNFELWIELGMQSQHNRSLSLLNRGHNNESTIDAIKSISDCNIKTCLHIILGIPGETWQDMMNTADTISNLPVSGVKLHHLHIIKNTPLEKIAIDKKYKMIAFKEYISTACDFIERLRPDILIHRLAGDRGADTLIEPKWGLQKGTVLQGIEDEFNNRCTYQGFLYKGNII